MLRRSAYPPLQVRVVELPSVLMVIVGEGDLADLLKPNSELRIVGDATRAEYLGDGGAWCGWLLSCGGRVRTKQEAQDRLLSLVRSRHPQSHLVAAPATPVVGGQS